MDAAFAKFDTSGGKIRDLESLEMISILIPDGKLNYREFCELMHSKEKKGKS